MKLTGAATKPPPFSSPLPLLRHQSIRASRTRLTCTRPWKTAASGPTTTATSGGNAGNAGAADEESDRAPCVPSRLGARREARLSARRRESIKLLKALQDQEHGANAAAAGGGGGIGEFLRHPAGVESLLNTRALQSFAPLEPERNEFRCSLDRVQFLGFQVTPVLDVRVTPTLSDCTVELLSCRFEGSDSVEQQNELFSAFMRNHITWGEDGGEPCLDIDVNLEVTLEVYTKPFSLLPLSAVEKPGNLLMQGLLDRLVPMLGEQLLRDYHSWVQQQSQVSELQATVAE